MGADFVTNCNRTAIPLFVALPFFLYFCRRGQFHGFIVFLHWVVSFGIGATVSMQLWATQVLVSKFQKYIISPPTTQTHFACQMNLGHISVFMKRRRRNTCCCWYWTLPPPPWRALLSLIAHISQHTTTQNYHMKKKQNNRKRGRQNYRKTKWKRQRDRKRERQNYRKTKWQKGTSFSDWLHLSTYDNEYNYNT